MDWPTTIEAIAGTLRVSTPVLLAALGAVICERSGVINIALEGIMLCGAFTSAATTYFINEYAVAGKCAWLAAASPWFGVCGGMLAGVAISALLGLMAITGKANQIVAGLAINILAVGVTQTLLVAFFGSASTSPKVPTVDNFRIPLLADIPYAGRLFELQPFVYAALALVVVIHLLLYRTRFGLRVRAVGEHPTAVAASGVGVTWLRYRAVLICGALAGLGGAALANEAHSFTKMMTGGRGYIALTAVIFGRWTPIGAFCAALLFGFADKVKDLVGDVPPQITTMFPYLTVVFVMFVFAGWAKPPAAAGIPFEKGQDVS
ncbi:MAG: ABC transporter permease [Planctomycetota bacterium]|nr:ABC transporter permease [Planctomycetota bacterium]